MREDLMAYVLGELDEQARSEVERELASSPALRAEVERIRRCLCDASGSPAHGDAPQDEIPEGLAERISHDIPRWSEEQVQLSCDEQYPSPGRVEFVSGRCNFTMVDMTVAMAVILAIAGLLMPGLNVSRSDSQRLACQNNLRELGTMFTQYSSRHGFMPLVAPREHAGVYSIRLAESDLASHQMMGRLVVCPASPQAIQLRREGKLLAIPTAEEYKNAQGESLLRIRRTSGGSYAFQIGYVHKGYYYPPSNRGLGWVPILSDGPNVAAGRDIGANHGGAIINTLFQDGSVQPLSTCLVARNQDHLFLNQQGEPLAGNTWGDAMLSTSYAGPLVNPVEVPWKIRIRFKEF